VLGRLQQLSIHRSRLTSARRGRRPTLLVAAIAGAFSLGLAQSGLQAGISLS
jgi:hypothetical protein